VKPSFGCCSRLPTFLVGIARGMWRCRIGADTSTHGGGGRTDGRRCRPNVELRLPTTGGVLETSGDILSSCGVTRSRSVSMAMPRHRAAASSVGETASGRCFQGRGAEWGAADSANKRVPEALAPIHTDQDPRYSVNPSGPMSDLERRPTLRRTGTARAGVGKDCVRRRELSSTPTDARVAIRSRGAAF
jgi:hypothetical protein